MKKLMSVLLAVVMIFTLSLTAFAYDTDVVYEANEINQEIDVDGDGQVDGTITDETPYLLVVPEELEVDGPAEKIYIAGITAKRVMVTIPYDIDMTDEYGNHLDAKIPFEAGSLILPISLTSVGSASETIYAKWYKAPLSGSWTGNFEYRITV